MLSSSFPLSDWESRKDWGKRKYSVPAYYIYPLYVFNNYIFISTVCSIYFISIYILYLYACVCVYVIQTDKFLCRPIFTHSYLHTHIYIHTHTHTHIQTLTQANVRRKFSWVNLYSALYRVLLYYRFLPRYSNFGRNFSKSRNFISVIRKLPTFFRVHKISCRQACPCRLIPNYESSNTDLDRFYCICKCLYRKLLWIILM